MSAANYSPPAFPTGEEHGFNNGEPGMTLRDYFAAKAMQGWMVETEHPHAENIAKTAYQVADAMLAERAK